MRNNIITDLALGGKSKTHVKQYNYRSRFVP